MNTVGTVLKMKSKLEKSKATYQLPMADEFVDMNKLIGKKITLKHTGNIFCVATGKKILKSYNQGYSYQAYINLAQCDQCIMSPEMCHYDKGTCREPEWAQSHCMQPHIVYLSLTSDLKIGITRKTQIPTRFIDQGAHQALPVLEVSSRYHSGLIEHELKSIYKDRTNWRNMLKGKCEEVDLIAEKEKMIKKADKLIRKLEAKILDHEIIHIQFPNTFELDKFKSFSFEKEKEISGKLMGIKGQYLIFEDRVLNIRKHQGYELELKA